MDNTRIPLLPYNYQPYKGIDAGKPGEKWRDMKLQQENAPNPVKTR